MPTVYLAVGHGRRDDGVFDPGTSTPDGRTEQSEGAPIVAAAAEALRDAGIDVVAQQEGDPNFPGYTREANEVGADLAVTVHHDWTGAPRGCFGHWFPGSSQGKALADAIRDALDEDLDWPCRHDWHRGRNLHFLRNTAMPAVLWECDRIGEVTDHAAYGRAIAAGIAARLGIELEDDMDAETKRKIHEIHDALGGDDIRDVADDLQKMRRELRAQGQQGGRTVARVYRHDVPEEVEL